MKMRMRVRVTQDVIIIVDEDQDQDQNQDKNENENVDQDKEDKDKDKNVDVDVDVDANITQETKSTKRHRKASPKVIIFSYDKHLSAHIQHDGQTKNKNKVSTAHMMHNEQLVEFHSQGKETGREKVHHGPVQQQPPSITCANTTTLRWSTTFDTRMQRNIKTQRMLSRSSSLLT
jgi:hypothetical protein